MYSYKSPCMSRSFMSCSYSSSRPVIIFCNTCGVGIRNIASSIYLENAEDLSLLMDFIKGNTFCPIISCISLASLSLNFDQRISWPSGVCGKILLDTSPPNASIPSFSISFSSRERINIRYVNCSITVRGCVMPPAHISVHILSILFLTSPVIICNYLLVSQFIQIMISLFYLKCHYKLQHKIQFIAKHLILYNFIIKPPHYNNRFHISFCTTHRGCAQFYCCFVQESPQLCTKEQPYRNMKS
ncbi:MAG: hypothetical protein BWY74_03050 [Firmicutes bacterium ADurb.Bin419]|nr:MAG: hypothetical protein BWY74_03050 [Firmicutes bacterium ADurb.Bin419]